MVRFWPEMQAFFEVGATELDDGKRKEAKPKKPKEKEPMKCPRCKCVHAPAPACPACGFVMPKISGISHVAGELVEVEGSAAAGREEKQDVWSQLLYIANERGYKEGWAAHKYKTKFGVWPRGLDDAQKPPTSKLQNWIVSQQIAYAKAKKKA
jgi:hypothetical protein